MENRTGGTNSVIDFDDDNDADPPVIQSQSLRVPQNSTGFLRMSRLETDEEKKEDAEQDADFDEGAGDPLVSKPAS